MVFQCSRQIAQIGVDHPQQIQHTRLARRVIDRFIGCQRRQPPGQSFGNIACKQMTDALNALAFGGSLWISCFSGRKRIRLAAQRQGTLRLLAIDL